MNIYFISDLHIDHANIIKCCNRPFTDIDEMRETLIANWNKVVQPNDLVYNLGDITLKNAPVVNDFLDKIQGRQKLIYGNHEYWTRNASTRARFESINKTLEITIPYQGKNCKVLLTHFPVEIEGTDYDYIIYGHIHNNEPDPFWEYQKTHANVLNACVEVNGYQPVTFEQLIENNRKIKNPGVL